MEPVELPDEAAFRAFRAQCQAEQGWQCRYNREGVAVWGQLPPPGTLAVHRVKRLRVNLCSPHSWLHWLVFMCTKGLAEKGPLDYPATRFAQGRMKRKMSASWTS
uniref:Uncharacterized protein n=1 Tax=Sphaerodactylus townsendi TaxID=933632 RepID=A0ACB8FWI2_9SAUR